MLGIDLYNLYTKKLGNCKDVLSTKEVVEIIGISQKFIFKEIRTGHLKSFLINRKRHFTKIHLIEYLCSEHYQENPQLKRKF